MSAVLACGYRLRTCNLMDEFNREVLRISVRTSITSSSLVRIFEQRSRDNVSLAAGPAH